MTKWLDFNEEKLLRPQRISSYFIGKTPATNDDFHRVGAVWQCFVRARRNKSIENRQTNKQTVKYPSPMLILYYDHEAICNSCGTFITEYTMIRNGFSMRIPRKSQLSTYYDFMTFDDQIAALKFEIFHFIFCQWIEWKNNCFDRTHNCYSLPEFRPLTYAFILSALLL